MTLESIHYQGGLGGYSFDYPKGWNVSETNDGRDVSLTADEAEPWIASVSVEATSATSSLAWVQEKRWNILEADQNGTVSAVFFTEAVQIDTGSNGAPIYSQALKAAIVNQGNAYVFTANQTEPSSPLKIPAYFKDLVLSFKSNR